MPHIIKNAGTDVKNYLIQKFRGILADPNSTEVIETALPYGSGDERTAIIMKLISEIIEVD